MIFKHRFLAATALSCAVLAQPVLADKVPVTVDNFTRAETHEIMKSYVDQVGVGKLLHIRTPTPLDEQNVIRMNRDTLYSMVVIDMTEPVSIVKPNSDRFQSMLLINEDHSMLPAIHDDGTFTLGQELVRTRYMVAIFRTFANPDDPADVAEANALQDQIQIIQEDSGSFEIPEWDIEGLARVRDAINVLALTRTDTTPYFGQKALLNPLYHLLGTAAGWGGNPPEGAMYAIDYVDQNDGTMPYTVTVKDVPVHGFWSITVYNKDGFMEPNDLGVNSYNNVTAKPNDDESYTINFGGCDDGRINCLPIVDGWNYAIRMYQPMDEIITGEWTFPDFEPAG
ncbi:hypothetical protein C1J05_20025 [Sulfitobacter sp. JL08]|uniref:DUF1214 domain-containing protein n=1 Tax=Sulfitobacter sp. JL08 TaxID=2070369 RepID=UPI000E0C40C5|nr:DUF1214 domain-containing protein [Sulfitobacter sp. JL08]AXI56487.1 hypothetical protein C1J05_20025 [Sulfitobacter sp. JL08]